MRFRLRPLRKASFSVWPAVVFLYVAACDLLPEAHNEDEGWGVTAATFVGYAFRFGAAPLFRLRPCAARVLLHARISSVGRDQSRPTNRPLFAFVAVTIAAMQPHRALGNCQPQTHAAALLGRARRPRDRTGEKVRPKTLRVHRNSIIAHCDNSLLIYASAMRDFDNRFLRACSAPRCEPHFPPRCPASPHRRR